MIASWYSPPFFLVTVFIEANHWFIIGRFIRSEIYSICIRNEDCKWTQNRDGNGKVDNSVWLVENFRNISSLFSGFNPGLLVPITSFYIESERLQRNEGLRTVTVNNKARVISHEVERIWKRRKLRKFEGKTLLFLVEI